jgi:hypothetical protein
MRSKRSLGLVGVLVLILGALLGQNWWEPELRGSSTPASVESPRAGQAFGASVGFTSARSLQEHFEKHGAEFSARSKEEYLARAQALRDAPLSASVLERRRADEVITRFDRKNGAFVAFDPDGRIRTCFRPENGEDYFLRQAKR